MVDKLKLEVLLDMVDKISRPMRAQNAQSKALAASIKATQGEIKRLTETNAALQARMARGEVPTRAMARAMQATDVQALKLNNSLRDQQTRLEALNKAQQRRAAIQASTASIAGTRDKFSRAGAGMAMAGGAMLGGLAAPVSAYAQAEDAATGLRVAMMRANGQVPETFEKINALATKLGDKLPGTTADYQNMMTMLVRQGMSAEAILGGLGQATAYLAVQLKMPTEQAAEFASKMQDATKTPAKDMMSLMDIIQRTNALGVESGNMLGAFSKASPILGILKKDGVDAANALAPLFAMADQSSLVGESSGNAFRKVFQKAMDTSKVSKAGLGMDFTNGKGEFGGMENMFKQLDKLKGLSTEKRLDVIKDIFGDDAETLQALNVMIDNGLSGYNEMTAKMKDQADLQKRVNEQLGTLKNLWDSASGTFTNALAEFGAALAPDLKALVGWIADTAAGVREWSAAHPELSKWLMRIVAVVGVLLVVMGGIAMAVAAVLAPFALMATGMAGFGVVSAIVSGGFAAIGTAVSATTAFLLANPIVLIIAGIAVAALLIWKYWEPIKAFFVQLWGTVDAAFAKFKFLNYLFPFIGAARFVIANWEPIKAFFVGLWSQVAGFFSSGIGNISQTLLNWSPLGMLYAGMQKVLGYFGIELPGKFSEFGSMILQGLVNGITSGLTMVKDTISNAGASVVGWFKEKLGIHSPSAVFAELGNFTMMGLDQGLAGGQAGPLATIMDFGKKVVTAGAAAMTVMGGAPAVAAPGALGGAPGGSAAAGGGSYEIHVHAAPGMDEQALAKLVVQKIQEYERSKATQGRARMSDSH